MQISTIKAIIEDAGGPEYLLGFRFANGYKLVYSKQLIHMDDDFVVMDGKDLLIYHHVDRDGNTARSYLDVEEICHVYVRDSLEDKIYIRDFME